MYAYLTLLIFLVLVEDSATAKLICESVAPVRLCRQRPPYLPLPKGDRTYAAAIIDMLTDCINHNLRKRLDTSLYIQITMVLSKLLSYLARSRTKIIYHWSEHWRTLLSFVRFLVTYADDMTSLPRTHELVQAVVDLLVLAMTSGEAFLSDAASYDDLLYKLIESGEVLTKLRDAYSLASATERYSSINILIGVSRHYQELIESQRAKKEHLTPREINKIIKQGYDSLTFEPREGAEMADGAYREVEYRAVLKRITRVAVGDAAAVVSN